jgi:hypothetical protein
MGRYCIWKKINMITDITQNDIRIITWKSIKGDNCVFKIYTKTKQWTFDMKDSNYGEHAYKSAIVGLVNEFLKFKSEKENIKQQNKNHSAFDDLFGDIFRGYK